MKVAAILSTDDVGRFVDDLAGLEVRDFCEIRIEFFHGVLIETAHCLVTMEARTDYGEYFLWESFQNGGRLHYLGWAKMFVLPKTSPTPDW